LPPAEEDPELCKDPKIDAMFNTKDGEIIAFKGTYVHFGVIFHLGSTTDVRHVARIFKLLLWNFQENITGN